MTDAVDFILATVKVAKVWRWSHLNGMGREGPLLCDDGTDFH